MGDDRGSGAEGPPNPEGAMNGFGVVYAIGPLIFWLFGYDLPGDLQTSAGSDDAHAKLPSSGSPMRPPWPLSHPNVAKGIAGSESGPRRKRLFGRLIC
jgi:hypothetical protein